MNMPATAVAWWWATATPLDERDGAQLRELAQQHQLTVNTFAQAAWALTLRRMSGDRDVVFRRDCGRAAGGTAADAAHGRAVHQHHRVACRHAG
ncbi:hypothetical protein HG619_24140 [Pseudomonas syringae]|nr:hypothetical protein [Pseudomonas syringae]